MRQSQKQTYDHDERPFYVIRFAGNFDEIEAFVGGDMAGRGGGKYVVATPHGALEFRNGDWIVEDMSSHFIAVPDAEFRVGYRKVR